MTKKDFDLFLAILHGLWQHNPIIGRFCRIAGKKSNPQAKGKSLVGGLKKGETAVCRLLELYNKYKGK